MTDSEIIDALGGTGFLANLFGISPPSVSEWRISGIPRSRKQTLAALYPDKVPRDWLPNMVSVPGETKDSGVVSAA